MEVRKMSKIMALIAVSGLFILVSVSQGICLESIAKTPAQKEVAAVLEKEGLSSIKDAVLALPVDDQLRVLEQLTPRKAFTLVQNSIRGSKNKRFNMKRRMSKIMLGHAGELDVSDFSFNYNGTNINGELLQELLPETLTGGSAGESDLLLRHGFFISGTLASGDYDRADGTDPYEFDSWNLSAGTDYRLTEGLTAGVSLSFETSDIYFADRSKTDMSEFALSFYSLYTFRSNTYLQTTAGYGWDSYEASRDTGVAGIAVSDPKGHQWYLSFEFGRDFEYERWRFEPSVGADYTKVDIDAYTEVESSASLVVTDQEASSFVGKLGGRMGYEYDNPNSFFVPEVHAYWEHEFANDSRAIDSAFAGAPGTIFAISTEEPDRDYIRVGFGLTGHLKESAIISLSADSVVGYDDLEEYSVSGSIKWKF